MNKFKPKPNLKIEVEPSQVKTVESVEEEKSIQKQDSDRDVQFIQFEEFRPETEMSKSKIR